MRHGPWDEPARIVFTPTEQEFLAAARLTARRSPRQIVFALTGAALAGLLALLAQSVSRDEVLLLGVGIALMCLPLAQLVMFMTVGPTLARRANARRWEPDAVYTVGWTDAGVTIETERMAMRLPWSIYIRRRENDEMILLYQSTILCQFVPKRVLSADQLTALRPLLDAIPAW